MVVSSLNSEGSAFAGSPGESANPGEQLRFGHWAALLHLDPSSASAAPIKCLRLACKMLDDFAVAQE
jgi:hypothetical protein